MEVAEQVEKPTKQINTFGHSVWEFIRTGIIIVCIVIPIRMLVAQPFVVSGHSMSPTFIDKDYLIIDEISYRLEDPKRFEVIVFKNPNNTDVYFIKRIIGLPGETVDINGGKVVITNTDNPKGLTLEQPYVKNESIDKVHMTLADDQYFVMGDNRSASSDSRYWGALKRDLIVGRAFVRLFPLQHIDLFPGYFEQKPQ